MDRSAKVQLLAWFPLVIVMGVYAGVATLDYIFDLRSLYTLPKATKLHREAGWSNLRNEVGRLLVAQLFLVLGLSGIRKPPKWVMPIEFFGIAAYKLFCSIKDRQLRLIVLEYQSSELRYPDHGQEAQVIAEEKKEAAE